MFVFPNHYAFVRHRLQSISTVVLDILDAWIDIICLDEYFAHTILYLCISQSRN